MRLKRFHVTLGSFGDIYLEQIRSMVTETQFPEDHVGEAVNC